MDLLVWIETNWIAIPVLALTAGGVLGVVLDAVWGRRVPKLRALGSPATPIAAALSLFAIAAISTISTTRDLVAASFEPTELGLVRGAYIDVGNIAQSIDHLVGLQALTAVCLLALVPAAVLGAWRRASGTSLLARVAPTVAAFAVGVPVLAGAATILFVVDRVYTTEDFAFAAWNTANAIEVGRWAVLGLGATGMMAATPIVVEAASRGHVVGRRAYGAAQILLIVGFGAWALTRFCAEDVRRGPVASVQKGEFGSPAAVGISATNLHTIDLPRGAWCDVNDLDPERELLIPLGLTHSLEGRYDEVRFVGVESWRALAARSLHNAPDLRPLLVAAVDRRVTDPEFVPYLEAAADLGIKDVAILTFTDDRHRTLTLGEVYTRRSCVLVRTEIEQATEFATSGVWWGSLARRITEEKIRRD